MTRLLIAVAIVVAAMLLAWLLQRRKPAPPTGGGSYTVPAQIDRADFDHPDTPWLIAVFTSATCNTCAGVVARASAVEAPGFAVHDVEIQRHGDLHERYRIDGVPTLVIADSAGVVRASFLGPLTEDDLLDGVAEALRSADEPPPSETAVNLDGL